MAKLLTLRFTKVLAVAGAFVAFGCGETPTQEHVQVFHGEAQGTTYTVKYLAKQGLASSVVEGPIEAVDVAMNAWRSDSWLTQVNGMDAGRLVIPDSAGIWQAMWDQSNALHRQSNGAFDVTVEPWMRLWGFRGEHVDQVTQQQVDSVRMFVGLNGSVFQTERSEPKGFALLKRDGRGRLDFNAIAQGYTVDLMLEALQREGVRHAMVELGGEVRCVGTNAQGEPWRIAVDRPQAEGRTLQAIVPVEDRAVCTSGNYRKVRVVNGQTISHTIDPRTGRPVTHGLLSATVMAPTAAMADGLATACMVMGPDAGKEWIQLQGDKVDALFITAREGDGFDHWATPRLAASLEWLGED